MRRKYIFPEILVEIQNGDQVNLELQLLNSYDSTWPFIVLLGAFRLVCENGLVVGKKFFYLRKRHVQELYRMNFGHQVSTALQRFERQQRGSPPGCAQEIPTLLLLQKVFDSILSNP